jgi:hypothetical protein
MKLKLSDVVNMNQVIDFYHYALKVDEANEKSTTGYAPATHYFFENKGTICFYWISIKRNNSILILIKLNIAENTLEFHFEEKLNNRTIKELLEYLCNKKHKYIKVTSSNAWKDALMPYINNLHETVSLII